VHRIIKRDPENRFRFAAMQSDIARELIEQHHEPGFYSDTILLIKNGVCYERSDAVLEIMKELPGYGFRYRILKLTPKPVRDGLYNLIAKNRYRYFGKRDRCMVPTSAVRDRFLE
jgi:predicted DCC family thiol-disulfide oxidoreductase YuxK